MAQADAQKWRNVEWAITAGPGGSLSQEQITQCLLMDIRSLLHRFNVMAVVVIGLAAISLVLGLIYTIVALGSP